MNRRTFVQLAGLPLAGGALLGQTQRPYDILIQGGEVRDPARKVRRKADVAIAGGRIAAIEERIDSGRAMQVIDARDTYVVPGLIDLHTHCYFGASGLGIDPDPVGARSGVTTWVDAGTFAYDQIGGFRRFVAVPSKVRVYGFVYLYPSSRNPDLDPVKYARSVQKATGEAAANNRDIILGVKLQVGSNMNGRYSLDFLKIARELCDQYKLPLMAHISFSPPETDQVMELMRAGDVVTHMYNRHTLGIIEADGKVKASVREARRRGVLFDVGHGLGSFNFEAARKAIGDGFLPDTISTDIYNLNLNGPVYDMPTTMSKMLHLGMSLDDILVCTTAAPARIVNRVPMLGSLELGAPADVALLAVEDGSFPLVDSQRATVTAKQRIVCKGAVCRGVRIG
ncbi:MAG: amidohydrolase/deacetylase family metallohydrolase [Bryobacteraceae bacterium]|nr:amidohydrolase/deacetylase family metallohydrolase [Bryobacteraceae bacterium]